MLHTHQMIRSLKTSQHLKINNKYINKILYYLIFLTLTFNFTEHLILTILNKIQTSLYYSIVLSYVHSVHLHQCN